MDENFRTPEDPPPTPASQPLVVNFGGIVHPQAGNWRLSGPVNLKHETAEITISLLNSAFSVRAVVRDPPAMAAEEFQGFMTRLWYDTDASLVSVLDALGFCLGGAPMQIELVTGSIDGNGSVIGSRTSMGDLSLVDGDEVDQDLLGPYLAHSVTNSFVRHALADIRMATGFNDDCFFYCYRAVESMRQFYLDDPNHDDTAAKKVSWARLREDLGVEESTLIALRDKANARRHGGDSRSQFAERHKALVLVRRLLTTFIAKLPPPPPMLRFDA